LIHRPRTISKNAALAVTAFRSFAREGQTFLEERMKRQTNSSRTPGFH
jgi:hypothetical protein